METSVEPKQWLETIVWGPRWLTVSFFLPRAEDKWEFPWYATWDLAFHMLPMALVDPGFASWYEALVESASEPPVKVSVG